MQRLENQISPAELPSPTMALQSILLLLSAITTFFTYALTAPTALLAPITRDPATLQYKILLELNTPLKPTKLVLDLGGSIPWLHPNKNYTSCTPLPCHSPQCATLKSLSCAPCHSQPTSGSCTNATCSLFPENSITGKAAPAGALQPTLALPTTDGRNPGPLAVLPHSLLSCAPSSLLKGLANGVSGIAGLGRSDFSLPGQLATTHSFHFALCLSRSPSAPGLVFFGKSPYYFLPNIDFSHSLTYTPLIVNPISNTVISYPGRPSDEYFIGVTSIRVNGVELVLNSSLLSIDKDGDGGTKLSTIVPYSTLESSIYNALVTAFVQEAAAMNISRVDSVKPFGACFDAYNVLNTRGGPGVPIVDLILQDENSFWRITGANSMVKISEEVLCLGFLDGGFSVVSSIVIGGHQMEDILLQFNVDSSTLGFSSSLLFSKTACANFNFTSSTNLNQEETVVA